MSLNNLDMKKAYYYIICIMAFFVLMWGTVDLISTSVGIYAINKDSAPSFVLPEAEGADVAEKNEQFFDAYYQKKMLNDRFWDSLSRMLIAGLIFAYFRFTVNRLEKSVA